MSILDRIEIILNLENDKSFVIAKGAIEATNNRGSLSSFTFGNTTITMDKKSAMSNALSLILRNFLADEVVKKYLDENERQTVHDRISTYQSSDTSEENQFFAVLYLIEDHLIIAYERKNMETIISSLLETAEFVGSTTAKDNLIKEKPSIEWAINEIVTTLRQKAHITYGKEIPGNIAKRCTIIMGLADNIRYFIDHENSTGLYEDTQKFCNIAQNIQKSLNKDKDYALTTGEIHLLEKIKVGSTMNNERTVKNEDKRNELAKKAQLAKRTELAKSSMNSSLQRVPVEGTTEEPIKKVNLKKYIIGGVAVLVAIASAVTIWGVSKTSKKSSYNSDVFNESVTELQNNWNEFDAEIPEDKVKDLYTLINGGVSESPMSASEMEDILSNVITAAVVPGVNNILADEENEIKAINVSSLIAEGTEGLDAVKTMEYYLNCCLQASKDKSSNGKELLRSVCSNAFDQEAKIIGEGATIDGLNVKEGTTTNPGVRLVWVRLAHAVNAFAGTLGEEFIIKLGDNYYYQSDLNDGKAFESIAAAAKEEMGLTEKINTK